MDEPTPPAPNRSPKSWPTILPWLLVAACALVIVWLFLASRPAAVAERDSELRAILAEQESAWNRGDLAGFMAHYWNSDNLKFLSGADVTTGWQATYQRYQKRYKSEGKEMGQLKFELFDVEVISPDAAIIRGRWGLTMRSGETPNGLFTLLLRKLDTQWKIVSDHTSVAEKK